MQSSEHRSRNATRRKRRPAEHEEGRTFLIAEIIAAVEHGLCERGIADTTAESAAVIASDAVATEFEGQQFHIALNRKKSSSERDAEILRAMESRDASSVARDFGICYGSVYAAARRARAAPRKPPVHALPQVTWDIGDAVARSLRRFGIEAEAANAIGVAVADRVASRLGGTQLYIPKRFPQLLVERDAEVLRSCAGGDFAKASSRFGLSQAGIEASIRRAKARARLNSGKSTSA